MLDQVFPDALILFIACGYGVVKVGRMVLAALSAGLIGAVVWQDEVPLGCRYGGHHLGNGSE